MEQRILFKYVDGPSANRVEEFAFSKFRKIVIGRDPTCDLKFDADREDLVSRRHAMVAIDKDEPLEVSVVDLGSRNGTFVNKQRIFSPVKLTPGDVVQFGAGGPQIEFDVDPRPAELVRPTRLAVEPSMAAVPGPTREAPGPVAPPPTASPVLPAGVGKATVERMIEQSKSQSKKWAIAVMAVVVVAAGITATVLLTRKEPPPPPPPKPDPSSLTMTPTAIAQGNTDSVVFFEVAWKLVDVESGRQLNQVYVDNAQKDKEGKLVPLVPGAGDTLPLFVMAQGTNKVEPLLSTDDGKGKYKAIGGQHSGSGFVVSPDGFILTNRHVAATWHTSYHFPPQDRAGLLVVLGAKAPPNLIPASQFPQWVPANAQYVIRGSVDQNLDNLGRALIGKNVEGRNDYLDVTFAKNRLRIPSKLARVSDRIDVAMVKIDLPRSLRKVELYDNYESVKPGDAAIVMGYPGVSPEVFGVTRSKDVFNPEIEAKVIPDPTVSVGNVGRILRAQESEGVISSFGDVYQLTINSTGGGNSGGPVFDDRGRVIAIYTSGRRTDASISFAVPIRYGMELMGTGRAIK